MFPYVRGETASRVHLNLGLSLLNLHHANILIRYRDLPNVKVQLNMTALPKYMVKRLIAENGVALVQGNIHITITNILATIPLDKVPGDLARMATIKVDGEAIMSPDKQDMLDKIKIIVKGKEYPVTAIKEIDGGEFPTGEAITFVIPNVKGLAAGETHAFEAVVFDRPKKSTDPLIIAFERKIC